ncbi:MAG: tRNA 4-thiouridine(8) synthase ThiI [Deltaproteobacteria bacterium]|nr:tRNA 4-thiouridine(8) synthase ThiI [Deltaproteobacteria bacterium]
MTTGIGLFSGGLDSILAVKVLQEQGICVECVCFATPFFGPEKAHLANRQLNIPLHVVDITDAHLAMLRAPRYGFGKNMNPCIDCHGLMLREAGALMDKFGAQFLFTGEVLGERPMSQNRNALRSVEKLAGLQGRILRPLSARLLPETTPEKDGSVDRSRLLAIEGRSRKPQMELVEKYGIQEFPEPAGGCLLTDPGYSRRLRDLMLRGDALSRRNLELLKVGRHLRFDDGTKIIIGRNERENERIERLRQPGDVIIVMDNDMPGPTILIPGGGDAAAIGFAASACVRYSKAELESSAPVAVSMADGAKTGMQAEACLEDEIAKRLL